MGTKKNIYNLFGNLSMADNKFLPGGKGSRDPSPRPKTTSMLEKARDPTQENWSKDQEKARHKDIGTFPLKKGGKEQNAEGDKSRNGRLISNCESDDDHREKEIYLERGTFPRMSKYSFDPRMRIMSSSQMQDKKDRRPKDYPKREETESYRDERNHETRPRTREEGIKKDRWSSEDEKWYQGEKYSDELRDRRGDAGGLRDVKEKNAPRKREKTRSEMDRIDPKMYYTDRVFEMEGYSDGKERPSRRDERKDPRGDRYIDERQPQLDRERGDGDGQMYRNKDRGIAEDRSKKSRAFQERRMERSADEEKWRETDRGFRDARRFRERNNGQDGVSGKRSGCHSPGGGREKRGGADEERKSRLRGDSDEKRKTSRQRASEQERGEDRQRYPERTERSQRFEKRSDGDDCRGTRGGVLEIQRMWLDPQRGKNSKERSTDRERRTRQKEEWGEEEKLQGVRGSDERRNSGEPDQMCSKNYRRTPVGRNEYTRGEPEGASVDGEESKTTKEKHKGGQRQGTEDSWQKNGRTKNTPAHSEESDREEGGGSDYSQRSRSEEGSEVGWKEERYRMPLVEDGFMTLSSSGEDIEKEFRDPTSYDSMELESPAEGEEEKKPENWEVSLDDQRGVDGENPNLESHHVFNDDEANFQENIFITNARRDDQQEISNQYMEADFEQSKKKKFTYKETKEVKIQPSFSEPRQTAAEDRTRSKGGRVAIGKIKRDSKTEKLLKAWKEKNNEPAGEQREQSSSVLRNPGDGSQEPLDQTHPFMNQINIEEMSEEDVEAVLIRMSGAWSTEDPKRYSKPPHLKWATSVVREILGTSEENAMDEPSSEMQKAQSEASKQQEEVAERAVEVPSFKFWKSTQCSDGDGEDNSLSEDFEGMGQNQTCMLSEQLTAGPVATHTSIHADTLINTGGGADRFPGTTSGQTHSEKKHLKEVGRANGTEMYLGESYMLYKPYSSPSLNYISDFDPLISTSRKCEGQEDDLGAVMDIRQEEVLAVNEFTCGIQDLGFKAGFRRKAIRKRTERRSGTLVQMEGVAGHCTTEVFSPEDDADIPSMSMGETQLRTLLHQFPRKKRNSKYFKAAQLYQQYSEAAQNIEILRQGRTDVLSVGEEPSSSPVPSPQPSRRPLPSLPTALHPHSLSQQSSSIKFSSLPLPKSHSNKRRPSSPRLSISQPGTLWRDLPGVRDSNELEELTENQWRLQEVRFEVVTSEASYCRSLDIVVEHFVKCKPLQDLLGNQDRNWLFSRLLEVRAISHRFLEKLEERVDSDIMHFTVCDIIAKHCKRFRAVYVPYLTNQSYQDATYQRLMLENPTFKQLVESIEKSAVCQRLPLRSFLVLPFQRITRLKLLVQNIVKRTTPGTEEANQAIKAMKLLESIIQKSNDSISQMKSIESLVSLNAKVDFECKTLPLISQSRRWVREGPVIELMDFACKDAERSVYLHLFNDYLLLSLQKEGGRFTVINHVPVNELQVENCRVKLHSLQKNLFRLQMSTNSYLLRTDTQSDKLRWISALKRPHDQVDFSAAQDCDQMLCVKAYMAQQPDELSLDKAEVILVHQDSSDNWVEGTRLSDFHRGWVPKSHLETISNSKVKERNLSDAFKLTTATAAIVAD